MHVYASTINPNLSNLEKRSYKSHTNTTSKSHHIGEGLGSTINLNITTTPGGENLNYLYTERVSEVEDTDTNSMYTGGVSAANLSNGHQSGSSVNSWENIRREVRIIESKLETKIQAYSWLSTKAPNGGNRVELLHDEENPLLESEEEANLANEIEDLLATLSDCNERMGSMVKSGVQGSNSALLQRYREILFDFSSEYKKLNQVFQRNRESVELFRNRRNSTNRKQSLFTSDSNGQNVNKNGDQETKQSQYHGSAMEVLMQERRGISSSIRSVSSIISQALEITDNLTSQRDSINTSTGRMGNVNSSIPSLNRMVGIIQQKKTRDNIIIGSLIGFCICFSLWYCFG